MIKKYIKPLIIIFSVLMLALISYYFISINSADTEKDLAPKMQVMTDEEKASLNLFHSGVYEVVSRDEFGKITAYKFIKLKEEESIELEFMSDNEKISKGVSTDSKIQVLKRDGDGNIISYRLIKDDSDIVKRY
jgi:hypothetical protein